MITKMTAITVSICVVFSSAASAMMTKEKVLSAQDEWAQGIVKIGHAKLNGGDYKQLAKEHIDNLYAYKSGNVLFKPTKAEIDQFRETFDEAHSYFVKGIVDEDKGFAINPWYNVRFDNHDIQIHGDMALAMGNYYFTTGRPQAKTVVDNDDEQLSEVLTLPLGNYKYLQEPQEVKVEYTFAYRLDENGDVKIVLHHSSLPYGS